jgi:hypothetical protein
MDDNEIALPFAEINAELREECGVLIDMIYAEVGKKWMSFALRCQIEKLEHMLEE